MTMDAKHRPMRAVKADAAAKAMKVWTARVNGETWESAAEVAGFSDAPGAVRAVRNYFGALPPTPTAEDARVLWRERLELLWRQAVIDAQQQRPARPGVVAGKVGQFVLEVLKTQVHIQGAGVLAEDVANLVHLGVRGRGLQSDGRLVHNGFCKTAEAAV